MSNGTKHTINVIVVVECRLNHVYKPRYWLLHMYFRLMAAIFDLPVTLTSESIRIRPGCSVLLDPENKCGRCRWNLFPVTLALKSFHVSSNVLLDPKNGVIYRKFSDITLESRNLIYIRSDGRHFNFCGRGFDYCET